MYILYIKYNVQIKKKQIINNICKYLKKNYF